MMTLEQLLQAQDMIFDMRDKPLLGGTCVEMKIELTKEVGTLYALIVMPMTTEQQDRADENDGIDTEIREYIHSFDSLEELVATVFANNFDWVLNEEIETESYVEKFSESVRNGLE
jgi:hypothetical protein